MLLKIDANYLIISHYIRLRRLSIAAGNDLSYRWTKGSITGKQQ